MVYRTEDGKGVMTMNVNTNYSGGSSFSEDIGGAD